MTPLDQQTTSQLGGRLSVLYRQRRDHEELERLLTALAAADPEQEGPLLRRIYRLVFPHAFAEESVLWPVLRRVLPDGEELTRQVEREHQEVNRLVCDLDRHGPLWEERPATLRRLSDVLMEDVRDEEDELLPRLQERLSRRRLRLLGLAWEAVRRVAPTRAHPIVSRRPPGNVVAALPLTLLDRARDHAAAMRDAGVARHAAGTAERALGHWAGSVEQWRLMRRGETPDTRA